VGCRLRKLVALQRTYTSRMAWRLLQSLLSRCCADALKQQGVSRAMQRAAPAQRAKRPHRFIIVPLHACARCPEAEAAASRSFAPPATP